MPAGSAAGPPASPAATTCAEASPAVTTVTLTATARSGPIFRRLERRRLPGDRALHPDADRRHQRGVRPPPSRQGGVRPPGPALGGRGRPDPPTRAGRVDVAGWALAAHADCRSSGRDRVGCVATEPWTRTPPGNGRRDSPVRAGQGRSGPGRALSVCPGSPSPMGSSPVGWEPRAADSTGTRRWTAVPAAAGYGTRTPGCHRTESQSGTLRWSGRCQAGSGQGGAARLDVQRRDVSGRLRRGCPGRGLASASQPGLAAAEAPSR